MEEWIRRSDVDCGEKIEHFSSPSSTCRCSFSFAAEPQSRGLVAFFSRLAWIDMDSGHDTAHSLRTTRLPTQERKTRNTHICLSTTSPNLLTTPRNPHLRRKPPHHPLHSPLPNPISTALSPIPSPSPSPSPPAEDAAISSSMLCGTERPSRHPT